ncbi:MAG TPA: TIGR04053 family radical SAM/SPASM domain-containing protein [Candidatus Eisenbacteria bacterium]|nr:TIGR04053 family radical SAM/SPASM domain-containing protein [Candidatus Eisenbacteria bacterium]
MDLNAAPILAFWETTKACRLACRHCRATAMPYALPGQLSTQEGVRLIHDLASFQTRSLILVLTGGDPFMRPDLFELAAEARGLGLPVALSPAVTPLLDEERLQRALDLGIRSLSISLDGACARTHEGVRQVDDHFAQTRAALELLVRMGFKVQVNTTVMRENVEELPEIAALLHEVGVHIWEVFFLIPVGRGAAVHVISPQEGEDVSHFLFDVSRYGLVVRTVEAPFFRRVSAWRREAGLDVDPAPYFHLGPLYRRLAGAWRARMGEPRGAAFAQTAGTRDGKGIVFVSHDGDVWPAGFLPVSLGNVRERSIVDIYRNHPLLRAIRAGEFHGRCGRCEFRDLCGGSRARAFAIHHDPLAEDPACSYEPAGSEAACM